MSRSLMELSSSSTAATTSDTPPFPCRLSVPASSSSAIGVSWVRVWACLMRYRAARSPRGERIVWYPVRRASSAAGLIRSIQPARASGKASNAGTYGLMSSTGVSFNRSMPRTWISPRSGRASVLRSISGPKRLIYIFFE